MLAINLLGNQPGLGQRLDGVGPRRFARPDAQHRGLCRQSAVWRAAARPGIAVGLGGHVHRLVLVEHMVGHRVGIAFEPEAPVAHHGRDWRQPGSSLRPVECHAAQARIERPVSPLHHHQPVAPAMEAEVVRRQVAPRKARIGIMDEDAVAVADDGIGVEEKAIRDGAAL